MSISEMFSMPHGTGPPVVLGHPPNTFVTDDVRSRRRSGGRQARALALGASLEMLPRQMSAAALTGLSPDSATGLARGAEVYLPCLPKGQWRETAVACERLRVAGLTPVPHLAARSVASSADLDDRLRAFAGAGADRLLLIAGDRRAPAGPFADTSSVLESGRLLRHGFRRLGVAAHPEGHPRVEQFALDAALARKVEYAQATQTDLWLVTQFGFAAQPVIEFLRGIALAYPGLCVRAGIPGPAKLHTLIAFAARCGVGSSIQTLTRKPGAVRLFGRWSPDALLAALGEYMADAPQTPLAGIHLFTFGGVENTLRWRNAIAQPWTDTECPPERLGAGP